ncbi:glycosyltransferase family 2 protein [Paenibacillus endoradicis]|uniref:glycosyltransferase family 2 protein n=1 Tax=Paenibacillus endoradicis TaxID=2972487 RepID=UPI0021595F83|nr:glycosyltransferase family A protein [Paenibacillus endoradicis]MCR8660521.1 glycosyltransferase family 2 protein [Paenibacillus endoradicis]
MVFKFTVIISNYNYEKYISEAIDSVLHQTYQNFELIIVDDGSVDNSKTIIEEYRRQHPDQIKAIFKSNGGQASAFNAGFSISDGDIITFLDADDYWYPDKLETIAYYHQLNKGVQHNLLINNEKKFTLLEDGVTKQKKGLELFGFLGTIPTSGLSFNREVLKLIFPIPEKDYRICADLYVKILFLNYHDIYSIDTPKGCYRTHDSNQWFINQANAEVYYRITLEKLNEVRIKENKSLIEKNSEAESVGRFLLDGLALNSEEKYVIYGTGELAKYFYNEKKRDIRVKCFSSSFVQEEGTFLFDQEVKPFNYLLNNPKEYDKIIIASTQVIEIKQFLLENGFDESKLIIPKF